VAILTLKSLSISYICAMINAAIFASGEGSNAENLMTHFAKDARIRIKLVVTNKDTAGVVARAAGNVPWYRLNQRVGSAVGLAPAIHKNPAKAFVFEALQLIASEKATSYPRAKDLLYEARNYLARRNAVLDQRNQAFKLICQAYIPAAELMAERFRPADEMAAMDPNSIFQSHIRTKTTRAIDFLHLIVPRDEPERRIGEPHNAALKSKSLDQELDRVTALN
jgi:hypothetical protein